MAHHSVLLPALFDALNADSDKVVEEALAVQVWPAPLQCWAEPDTIAVLSL